MHTFDEIARASPEYVEALYQQFRRDPASVDERWALLFKGYEFGQESGPDAGSGGPPGQAVADLVHGYRELGYLVADVDPLARGRRSHSLLDLDEFGFRDSDLDREMDCRAFRGLETAPLRELLAALERSYCGTLGVEYLALSDKAQREWLQERVERGGEPATADAGGAPPHLRAARGRRDVRAIPPREVRRPEALLAGGGRGADPAARRPGRGRGGRRRGRDGDGHAPPGPPERPRAHPEEAVRADPGRVRGLLSALGRSRRRRRQVPSRLLARPHGAQRAHHPPVDERESKSPRGHQSRRGRHRPGQAVVPGRCAAQARGPGAHARRRGLHGPGLGLRDAHAVGAAVLHHRRHRARHRQQPDRLHHGSRRLPRRPLSVRARAGDRRAGLPRQRRRPRGRRAGGAPGDRLSPGVRARRLRRPRAATAVSATTKGTIPASLSPLSTRGFASIPRWLSSTVGDSRRPG